MGKSLMSNIKTCYICGSPNMIHKHHIFGGANRKKSERDGCWCYLCAYHHNMSNEGVHFDRDKDLRLKKKCEARWMLYYNKSKDDFIREYGKNYI